MQVDARTGHVSPGRQPSSAYLMSWVAVAAFGLGYIGVAATRPDLLGAILPLAEPTQDQMVAGRTAADIADELATLRKWVHDLQHELAATRSSMQDQAAQNVAIMQRLASAEERIGAAKDVRAAEPQAPARPAAVQRLQRGAQAPAALPWSPTVPAPTAPPAAAQQVAQAPAGSVPAMEPPDPGSANFKVLNPAAQIATGSVPDVPAASAAAAPAAKPPAPQSPRAVEIGNFDSLDGLRTSWGDLAGRNATVLGQLTPRYRLAADGRATPFTLLAGPFENTADATRACTALRAKGVACRVGAYGGNAF